MSYTRFVGRMGGWHEEDAVQVKSYRCLTRQRQVCFVNGIERAAENRQPQLAYALSIFTELMRTSFCGRSWAPLGTPEIFWTTA